MDTLKDLHQKLISRNEHNKMIYSVMPLSTFFGVNHFYWTRIVSQESKDYFYGLGTHTAWHEFLVENLDKMTNEEKMRSPKNLTPEITLLQDEPDFKEGVNSAWDKFNINLTINIQKKIPGGIESFGFGVNTKHPKATQHLLNHLPLLYKFNDYFVSENQRLINLAKEFQIETSSLVQPQSHKKQQSYPVGSPKSLLKILGLQAIESLSRREIEVLDYLAHGYPARYIAEQLHLSPRTVQHHIERIKMKLDCQTKLCLIKKAKDLQGLGYLLNKRIFAK